MERNIRGAIRIAALAGVAWAATSLPAQTTQTAPDNTAVNKQDRSSQSPNADHAKNGSSDRQLMAHIRRDVVKDKTLSTYAHNVKIISKNGKVTLRGPVKSDTEKQTINQYATKYAGEGNVTDELTVKGSGK